MTPLNLLPTPEPRTVSPPLQDFYYNVSKWLIPDIVRVMNNGIPIDLTKVRELEATIDVSLASVEATLASNEYIKKYMATRRISNKAKLQDEITVKLKPQEHFLKDFDQSKVLHRSYYVKQVIGKVETGDYAAPNVPKWTLKDLKTYDSIHDCDFTDLLTKQPNPTIATAAMEDLASDKANIYNKQYHAKLKHTDAFVPMERFNPGSTDQKHELLTGMLGLQSDKLTDAWEKYQREYDRHWKKGYDPSDLTIPKNQYSWNRENVEKQLKLTDDPDLQNLLQALVDYSFGAIIKNNFIKSFYNYTIDGNLYGNLKLAGTKTFRLTSNSPNMLQMPSTGSIYSKPVKQCLIAPKGHVILAIDYGALTLRAS